MIASGRFLRVSIPAVLLLFAGQATSGVSLLENPDALAIAPSGEVVYVVDGNSDEVTPIVTATGRAGRAVAVGYSPVAVETSGATAYVVSSIAGTVTPLAAASGRAGARSRSGCTLTPPIWSSPAPPP
ncbi:MAG: YncE family protein [Streptosporangiaceae bacterium]